jgi:hypothetical protein
MLAVVEVKSEPHYYLTVAVKSPNTTWPLLDLKGEQSRTDRAIQYK